MQEAVATACFVQGYNIFPDRDRRGLADEPVTSCTLLLATFLALKGRIQDLSYVKESPMIGVYGLGCEWATGELKKSGASFMWGDPRVFHDRYLHSVPKART